VELGGDFGLDLVPGGVEQINDPVRIYLREMGAVPLLTREGEVDIAKRIERGQRRVLKALSRAPLVNGYRSSSVTLVLPTRSASIWRTG